MLRQSLRARDPQHMPPVFVELGVYPRGGGRLAHPIILPLNLLVQTSR